MYHGYKYHLSIPKQKQKITTLVQHVKIMWKATKVCVYRGGNGKRVAEKVNLGWCPEKCG